MLYSGTTGGFYDPNLHGDAIPGDSVEVSDQVYETLMLAQAIGMIIQPDDTGAPVAVDLPPPSRVEALTQLRLTRDALLRASDFTQIPDAPLHETEREAWRLYRQALRDLPEIYADDPASAVWPTPPGEDTHQA